MVPVRHTVLVVLLSACQFAPTVDGKRINDCKTDADCPCGTCADSVCLPLAPAANSVGVEVEEPVVNAGESCAFSVVNPACGVEYSWRQVSGPDVELEEWTGVSIATVTIPHVAAYVFEAETGRGEERVIGRATCTALIDRDAAWVIAGGSGSCTRDDPCGSFDDVRDNNGGNLPARTYLGRRQTELSDQPVEFPPVAADGDGTVTLGSEFETVEIHGGFLYPEWSRDVEAARTSLTAGGTLKVLCNDCTLTGLYQLLAAGPSAAFQLTGLFVDVTEDLTLREITIHLTGDTGPSGPDVVGLSLNNWGDTHVRDITVRADAGLRATDGAIHGVDLYGADLDIERLTIDVSAAESRGQIGVQRSNGSPALLDRLNARVGGGTVWNTGLWVGCYTQVDVWNSIFQVDGRTGNAFGADIPTGCENDVSLHSCLLRADSATTAIGLLLSDDGSSPPHVVNTIIDAGGAADHRYAVVVDDNSTVSIEIDSSVLIVDPIGATSASATGREPVWEEYTPEPNMASVLGCTDCVTVVESVPFLDPEHGDYRIPNDAGCCAGTGSPLGDDDPPWDFDRVTRPPATPSIGPFEPVAD